MNVMFVNPGMMKMNSGDPDFSGDMDYLHPPLGLLALAAYAAQAGYTCRVYDLNGEVHPADALKIFMKDFRPEVVCFTVLTATIQSALMLAGLCKEAGLKVVFGGYAAKFNYRELVTNPDIDAIVCGEGEVPLLKILDTWRREGADLPLIPGVYTRQTVDRYIPQPRFSHLDQLPLLNFDLIDMRPYVEHQALGLVTSRGCPFHCHFCSCQKMWSHKVTYQSLARILETLDNIVERFDYNGKQITFFDDTFTLDRSRIIEFCQLLKKRKYEIVWKAMTRCDSIDEELVRIMYGAGCRHLVFGIEGTTEGDMKRLNKGFNLDQVKKAVDIVNKNRILSEGYFIFGFPWQSREDLFQCVEKIRDFGLHVPRLSCLTPYPGTFFLEQKEHFQFRIPIPDPNRYTNMNPIIETDNFSLEDQARGMAGFINTYILEEGVAEEEEETKNNREEPFLEESVLLAQPEAKEMNFRISPYLVYQRVASGMLVFEYYNGNFLILNSSALEILKMCGHCHSFAVLSREVTERIGPMAEAELAGLLRTLRRNGLIQEPEHA